MKNSLERTLAVAVALTSLFLFSFSFVRSENPSIVITEIGAYEKEGNEWIEIYNRSDGDVDLTGWKFYEDDTNHKLSVAQGGDFIMSSGEYALIVDNADTFLTNYPAVSISVFDSSWGTLKESGEEVGLKDNDGSFVEQFTYIAAPDYSLERKDVDAMDYTANNWKEHPSGNTVGVENYWKLEEVKDEVLAQSVDNQEQTNIPQTGTSIAISYKKSTVLISEVVSDPADDENEFVEVFNTTDRSVELQGWVLEEGGGQETPLTGILLPRAYYVIENLRGNLNNNGDRIILRDGYGNIIDELTYGNWDDGDLSDNAKSAGDPSSLVRNLLDKDRDVDSDEFSISSTVTKGKENVITDESTADTNDTSIMSQVVINELYPNPSGSDTSDEFVELLNTGDSPVNLSGWKVVDAAGSVHTLGGSLAPQEFLVVRRERSGLALNNSGGETVTLFNGSGAVLGVVTYEGVVQEDRSYSRSSEGDFLWTSEVTPGKENNIIVENRAPIVLVSANIKQTTHIPVAFDASDTIDPDGDMLSFSWDFGDGSRGIGDYVEHVFSKEGVYTVVVEVKDAFHNTVQESIAVTVSAHEKIPSGTGGDLLSYIEISEFVANPVGTDATEYIELYNSSSEVIDLSGIKIDDEEGGSRAYTVPDRTYIEPAQYRVFGRQDTKIALNNTNDSVRLLYGDGTIVHEVRYDDVQEGASYVKDENGVWVWSMQQTPGDANVIVPVQRKRTPSRSVRKASSQKKVIQTTLENVRSEDVGDMVSVKGVVAVVPGTFSDQYMYIAGSPGVQVYMYSKDFPTLHVGDRVQVTGEISEAYGETRIKVKEKENIVHIDHPGDPSAEQIDIAQIGEPLEGYLVSVSAEVTDMKSSYIWIDDGTEEVKVYFKRGAGIDKKKFFEGAIVSVTGIVQQTRNGYQILPRSNADITYTGEVQEPAYISMKKAKESDREIAEKYLTATAGGLTSIVLGLLGKVHGSGLLRLIRKIVYFIARKNV